MIVNGSRYQTQVAQMISDSAGNYHLTVFGGPNRTPTKNFLFHKVIEGDRMDILAYEFLKDARLWWRIADANPEIFYPENLVSGTILRIPTS